MLYRVKKGFESSTLYVPAPLYGRKNGGAFDLSKCTQKELRYLYEVIKLYKYVEKTNEKEHQNIETTTTGDE